MTTQFWNSRNRNRLKVEELAVRVSCTLNFLALCFGAKCKLLEPFYFDKDNELTISDGNESENILKKHLSSNKKK
ncbi:hypothetical protein BpHYR1_026270, partial [Brachionus plicatilis]